MNKKRNNKRALVVSAVSLLLCMTMLVGSTFAWFTDNASTAVSNIVSGTLDIELLDGNTENANSLEGKTLTFAKADDAPEGEKVLFEPGAKYSLTQVYLHNAGSLHAKYQITITGIDGSSKLAEVLNVYVAGEKSGTLADLVSNGGIINSSVIAPEAYYTFGTIELEMQTTAGNEYQGLTMDGIAITVQATQATVEYDSEDNQYDADADFDELVVADNQAELNEAITTTAANDPVVISLSGTSYILDQNMNNKDITFSGSSDTTVDLTSFQFNSQLTKETTLTFDGVTVNWSDNNTGYQGFTHSEKVVYKNCTINGTQFMYGDADFINCTFVTRDSYAVYGRGEGTLTFTDCTFTTGGRAIMLYADAPTHVDVVLTNCTFSDDGTYNSKNKAVVETGDDAGAHTSTFDITITDCTATGFEQNSSTSNLWGNKDSIPNTRLNVVIDGVDVY